MADPPGSTPSHLSRPTEKPKDRNAPGESNKSKGLPSLSKRTKKSSPQNRQEPNQQSSNKEKQPSSEGSPPRESPRKPKESSKEIEERIGKLLTRCQRQFSALRPSEQASSFQVPPRPPDQAATSLGRELADAFLQSLAFSSPENALEAARHKLLESLSHRGIHPSIPHAFFEELTDPKNYHI
jgi:hypothetical protein